MSVADTFWPLAYTYPDPMTRGITELTFGSDDKRPTSAAENPVDFELLSMMVVGPRELKELDMLELIPCVCDTRAIIAATPIITMTMVKAVLTFFSLRSL